MSLNPPSATPPPLSYQNTQLSPSHLGATKWGTISGGAIHSPPPASSSGASVRRNHTIHGAHFHDKPRLEKHFEQPEHHAYPSISDEDDLPTTASLSSFHPDSLTSPTTRSDTAQEYSASLSPLQALYTKATVARNNSLPSLHHSSRLASHVPVSATQGRSSLFNSLSAITGGHDVDEHDWEKLIHSSTALGDDPLVPQQNVTDMHASAQSPIAESPWSDSLFHHQRFPSGPTSAQPHSPIHPNNIVLSSEGHQQSGSSSSTTDNLDQAPFNSSSLIGPSYLRRHQSLDHHSGRAAAQRLSSRSSDLLHREAIGHGTSSISSQLDQAFHSHSGDNSLSAASSPIVPSSFSKAPWNQPPGSSPSRFANTFSPSGTNPNEQSLDLMSPPSHGRGGSNESSTSSPLMDIHANLAKLDIRGSLQPLRGDSVDSRDSASATPIATATPVLDSQPTRPSLSGSDMGSNRSTTNGHNSNHTRKLPSLITNRDALARGASHTGTNLVGPASAAAYVPPIGHAHSRHQSAEHMDSNGYETELAKRFVPFTAAPISGWQEKESIVGRNDTSRDSARRAAEPWGLGLNSGPSNAESCHLNSLALNLALAQEQQRTAMLHAQAGIHSATHDEAHLFGRNHMNVQNPIAAYNRQLRGAGGPGMSTQPPFGSNYDRVNLVGNGIAPGGGSARPGSFGTDTVTNALGSAKVATPVDPATLVLQKGYNPALGSFDLYPPLARFFVIKSYTEDDVHKSLKYEIWASTDKGNQRLDKAFRESAHVGPIYLFFSVNASGHFCGMAQMLTPLDYTTSSNVWAQDGKWKGTFKVRWIYVKDLPNHQLRHIRLTNTPEVKPVTQSRDTQELTADAGREVLRIMAEFPAKTSLLQDFNFYEMQSRQQAAQKLQTQVQTKPAAVVVTTAAFTSTSASTSTSTTSGPSAHVNATNGCEETRADHRSKRHGGGGAGGGGGSGQSTPQRQHRGGGATPQPVTAGPGVPKSNAAVSGRKGLPNLDGNGSADHSTLAAATASLSPTAADNSSNTSESKRAENLIQ